MSTQTVILSLRNDPHNCKAGHTCQELARSLLWWIGLGSLRPFRLAPCIINKCTIPSFLRDSLEFKDLCAPNHLLQLLLQISRPYWTYQTWCLKMTVTWHLQKDSSEKKLVKILRLYLLVWFWDIGYLVTEQNLKCLLLKWTKINKEKIAIKAGSLLKNSGPTMSLTNRHPPTTPVPDAKYPIPLNFPRAVDPFENTETEEMCIQKSEAWKRLKSKSRLEQLTVGATPLSKNST